MNQTNKEKNEDIASLLVALEGQPKTNTYCLGLLASHPTCDYILVFLFFLQLIPALISVLLKQWEQQQQQPNRLGYIFPNLVPLHITLLLATLHSSLQSKLTHIFFSKIILSINIHQRYLQTQSNCQLKASVFRDIYNAMLHELNKK